MSRLVRINELVQRELSDLLHTRFRDRTVSITLTEVDVTSDLRSARVYYSVLGGEMARHQAAKLFEEIKNELRTLLAKRVILKYSPALSFAYDDSIERGNRTIEVLDELARKGEFTENPPEPAEPSED
jgi:ribosome-binding factor A